jgi:ornithine lipid ester-linked acyl 2-hydroxylase
LNKESKIWLSYSSPKKYKGIEPSFFNVSKEIWCQKLVSNWEDVLKEIQLNGDKSFVSYFNNTFSNKKSQWKFIPLKMWGVNYGKNASAFPLTKRIIEEIPYVASASFSKLEPETRIKAHTGDSNIMYRVHVPLVVPDSLPECGFRVLEESVSWEPGSIFAFCDAHEHEAWNNTKSDRIVLILDVIRPEFQNKYMWYRAQITATLWVQFTFQKSNIHNKLPVFFRVAIMNILAIFALGYIPLHNFFSKLLYTK